MAKVEEEHYRVIPTASNAVEALKAEVDPEVSYHLWNGSHEILFKIDGAHSYRVLCCRYPNYQGLFDMAIIDFADCDLETAGKDHDPLHYPQSLKGKGLKRFHKKDPLTETLSIGHIGPLAHYLIDNRTGLAVSPEFKEIKVFRGGKIELKDQKDRTITLLPVDDTQIMDLVQKRSISEANKEEFAKTPLTLPKSVS